jgi:pyridoxal phosphate enzyme (YggS family)
MADIDAILRRNLAHVEERMTQACQRAGRARKDVTLVAVTKYVSADVARRLPAHGVKNLGESRPQELWKKAEAIPEATWHLVGHLQRNKVEETLPVAQLIHSVDSQRLLVALNAAAEKQDRAVDVLLEVNLSGEEAKHGMKANEVFSLCSQIEALPRVNVLGLMTMAALDAEGEKARPTFASLRKLRDTLRPRFSAAHDLYHLSMGMTNDFEVAIEEGATLVRIGSALFHGVEDKP